MNKTLKPFYHFLSVISFPSFYTLMFNRTKLFPLIWLGGKLTEITCPLPPSPPSHGFQKKGKTRIFKILSTWLLATWYYLPSLADYCNWTCQSPRLIFLSSKQVVSYFSDTEFLIWLIFAGQHSTTLCHWILFQRCNWRKF